MFDISVQNKLKEKLKLKFPSINESDLDKMSNDIISKNSKLTESGEIIIGENVKIILNANVVGTKVIEA